MLMISSRNDLLLYSTTATNREETRFIKFARHRHQVVQPAPHLLNTNHTSHITHVYYMKIHKIRTQQRQQQTTAYTRRTSTCIGPPHHKLKEMCSPFFLILLSYVRVSPILSPALLYLSYRSFLLSKVLLLVPGVSPSLTETSTSPSFWSHCCLTPIRSYRAVST